MTDDKEASEQAWATKRTQTAFRALIDDMLEQLRLASTNEVWTPEARARAEADLARIMESVRREAVSDRTRER